MTKAELHQMIEAKNTGKEFLHALVDSLPDTLDTEDLPVKAELNDGEDNGTEPIKRKRR